ncbi:MAG: hypothetical protein ABR524_14510, partial [Thermoanaerobaculia bacterium]
LSPSLSVPSAEQGFGLPALDDALHFAGDGRPVFILDRPAPNGLSLDEAVEVAMTPSGGRLVASLVWTDPPTPANAATPLVHDLDLELVAPDGTVHRGNANLTGGSPDRLNNIEVVAIEGPAEGTWHLRVHAERVAPGARQSFAVIAAGAAEKEPEPARRRAVRRGAGN